MSRRCWSLVSASLSATLFPLKWQLIRDRLHTGLANITAAGADEEDGEGKV
jgi:hypothetical protein